MILTGIENKSKNRNKTRTLLKKTNSPSPTVSQMPIFSHMLVTHCIHNTPPWGSFYLAWTCSIAVYSYIQLPCYAKTQFLWSHPPSLRIFYLLPSFSFNFSEPQSEGIKCTNHLGPSTSQYLISYTLVIWWALLTVETYFLLCNNQRQDNICSIFPVLSA